MARLFLVILALIALVLLLLALGRTAQAVSQSTEDAHLPETVKTISYALLIALMFGVVTGWLGGL